MLFKSLLTENTVRKKRSKIQNLAGNTLNSCVSACSQISTTLWTMGWVNWKPRFWFFGFCEAPLKPGFFLFFSFSKEKDNFATTATTSKDTNKDEPSKNVEKPVEQNAVVPTIFTPKLPKTLPKSKTMPRLTGAVTSPKKRPRKSVSKVKRLEFNSPNQSKITSFFGVLQGPKKWISNLEKIFWIKIWNNLHLWKMYIRIMK